MFPKSQNNQRYRATTQAVIPEEVLRHHEQYGLSDKDFISQHPEVHAVAAAQIDLHEAPLLTTGWLQDVNKSEQGVQPNIAEYHEPSAEERVAGEVVAIMQVGQYITEVRRSPYTKQQLAGMTKEDFDLVA